MQLLNRTTRHASPTENGQRLFRARGRDPGRARGGRPGGGAGAGGAARAVARQRADVVRHAAARAGAGRFHGAISGAAASSSCSATICSIPSQDGFDVTLRIAELESSSLIARKIVGWPRMICASPDYLARHGTPKTSAGSARARLADLRLPADRQPVEAHRHRRRSLDPAGLVALRQQCRSAA